MLPSLASKRIVLAMLAAGSPASAAVGQARIERIIGAGTDAVVQRAGAAHGEPAAAGLQLDPGDMLRTGPDTPVRLICTTAGTPSYLVAGGFRGYIDVPIDGKCAVAIVEGHADVIAEDVTNTIGGTTPLASKGTQYSVDVIRAGRAVTCDVAVFEGEVFWRGGADTASEGSTMRWVGASLKSRGSVQHAELERSAALYASFDAATARAVAPQAEDVPYAQLKQLHYAVLAHPTDTATRVALAKEQIQLRVDDQAAYNLRRANVRDDAALRRYQIDPRTVRSNAVLNKRVYRAPSEGAGAQVEKAAPARADAARAVEAPTPAAGAQMVARPQPYSATGRARIATQAAHAAPPPPAAAAPPPPAAAPPTADADLELLAAGEVDEAIRNLETRVAAPGATSHDHYALAKAYDGRDEDKVREHASQAIKLHLTDGKLSGAELQEVRELLAAAG
jgi:hypothetical protein